MEVSFTKQINKELVWGTIKVECGSMRAKLKIYSLNLPEDCSITEGDFSDDFTSIILDNPLIIKNIYDSSKRKYHKQPKEKIVDKIKIPKYQRISIKDYLTRHCLK